MGFFDSLIQNDSKDTVKTPVQSGGGFFDNLTSKTPQKSSGSNSLGLPQINSDIITSTSQSTPAVAKAGTPNISPVVITKGLVDAYHGVKGAIKDFATQQNEPKPTGFFENLVSAENKLPQSEIGPAKDISATTKNPDAGTFFPKIFKPTNELNPTDINVKVPFTQKYVSVPSMFDDPRAFGGNKDNIVNKGVSMIANLPSDIIQSIPKALVTIREENLSSGKNESKHLSPFLASMYGSPEYENINSDIQKRIANGDGVLSAYIGGISGKALDVVFGASVAASALTKTAEILARGDSYSKIEAWKTLGSPKSEAELNANYKKYAQQFHPDKPTGNASAMTTINDAKSIIDKTGLPSTIDIAKQNGAKYTEWLGRQTELGPAEHFLTPDTEMKSSIQPKPLGTLELPGSRSVPGQAPAFGLSTDAVENVGGEAPKGGFFDNLVKPEEKSSSVAKTPGNVAKTEIPVYQGEKDLTVKTLEKLSGRSTVSKTFIDNLTNQPDLKQQERDVVREALKAYPDGSQVPVAEFANKVKSELLPLEVSKKETNEAGSMRGGLSAQYERITLPSKQRGEVKNYHENIYESPIKTSAGEVHFQERKHPGYFGHTRIEDMADNATRRVIEVQSDLYQKGNLEREIPPKFEGKSGVLSKEKITEINTKSAEREKEVSKLQQYNDPTAHFRMVREEIKKAAQDGKTKLQFPTGETAMKIEGLGNNNQWKISEGTGRSEYLPDLSIDDLKAGQEIQNDAFGSSKWIITDVLGDGKFKAIPKRADTFTIRNQADSDVETTFSSEKEAQDYLEEKNNPDLVLDAHVGRSLEETFDISGKVDTSNPIYKFYEKDLGRYLTSKYGAVRVTDGKGISWYEVPVSKEMASKPVEAFSRSFLGKATPTLGRGGRIPHAEIQQYIYKDIPKDQVRLIFRDGLVDGHANGKYTGVRAEMKGILKPMIELSSKGGKSKITTAFHESGHYIFDNFLSSEDKSAVLKLAEKEMGPITRASYGLSGYKGKQTILEEYVMDKYADYKANEAGYSGSPFKSFFRKLDEIIHKIKDVYNKVKGNLDTFFEERGGSQGGHINYMDPLGENVPKKTPLGKSVGKITVGGKEIDVTKGGTMEIPVSKSSLPANTPKQTNPLKKPQPQRAESSLSSESQKAVEKKGFEQPQLQEKPAMSQIGQRPLGSFPKPKVDTIKSSLSESVPTTAGNVKPIDKLISDGKIKVVSLSGKDTYLVKTGNTWKTARDESSAVSQSTPKEKTAIDLPPELEQKVKMVEMQKEQLETSPFKGKDNKIFVDKEGRVRELGDVKNPVTIQKMEDRIAESGIKDPTKFADGMETYLDKKKEIAKIEKEVKAEVVDYKKNGPRIQVLEKIKSLREDIKTLESNGLSADKQKSQIKKLMKETSTGLGREGAPLKTDRSGIPLALTERQKIIVENSKFRDEPKPTPPPFEGSYGEVKATENLAKQAESIVHGSDIPPDVSMRELIEKTVTPVTQKVNVIDTYLRTPDRVMNKIGFGTEAKDLRTAMDGYWKELPKNLARIGEWAKAVPAKSNERIFRFLDGQAIDLRPDEHLVASEIKKWLKEWADRLGIEEDRRVSDYITRIFSNDTPQEFDEELAKIITDTVPGSVYNPFTLRRLGARGYRMDTWKALEAYVKRGTRKVYMDPVLEKIEGRTGHELATTDLEKSQFKYIQRYINNINMRPSETDESIDNLIKTIFTNKTIAKIYGVMRKGSLGILPEVGQRPVASITRFMRQMTSRAMLGLNPGSALRNISQGINTYAVLGEKYTTIGYASLFKKGVLQELEQEGVLNAAFIQDKVLSATGKLLEKTDKGLYFFFETAEKINRGAAYFGAKSKYYADHTRKVDGVTVHDSHDIEQKAIEYAKNIVRKTQFSFDSIDTPVGMGSDIVKTLLQFQTFTTKQAEFLTEVVLKDKNYLGLLRYAVAGLAFVYTIGKIFGMKPQELVPIWRIGLPPSWTIPSAVVSASANLPDKYGRTLPLGSRVKNVWDAILKSGIPAGSQINKSYQGFKAVQQGGSMDASGRKQFSVGGGLGKNIQAIAFGKYANSAADDHFNGITEAERTYDNISKSKTAKDDFNKLIKANPALAKEVLAIAKRRKAGITPDDERIINMGVASGARARYVADKLNKLKTNKEKGALWTEYVKKKIITKDVASQLGKLIKK